MFPLEKYDEYQELLTELVNGLNSIGNTRSETPSHILIDRLYKLEKQHIAPSLEKLKIHQKTQKSITQTTAKIANRNAKILSIVETLGKAEAKLVNVLDQANVKLKAIQRAREGACDYTQIISYAHKIAHYTSAPMKWKPNAPPDGSPVFPPIPQDMHMKRSLLFQPDSTKPSMETAESMEEDEVAMDLDLLTHQMLPEDDNQINEEELLDFF